MKKSKFLTVLCLSMTLLFGQSVMASNDKAPEKEKFDIVAAKHQLAEKHIQKLDKNLGTKEKEKRIGTIQEKLNSLAAGETTKDKAKSELEKLGVYMLDVPEEEPSTSYSTLSQGSDITMNNVWITYDSSTGNWQVTGGGYWNNKQWFGDLGFTWWAGYTGETKNMPGYDSVGIAYFNTSGTYNATVLSSQGYWTDHNGWSGSSTSPSHGDGKMGVAFDWQDKVKLTYWPIGVIGVVTSSDCSYLGNGFSTTITYSSNFADFNGFARTFYVHTWNSTNISKMNFGISGKTFGVDIEYSSSSNRFMIFNNSDTAF
jgi:hypothetical protein